MKNLRPSFGPFLATELSNKEYARGWPGLLIHLSEVEPCFHHCAAGELRFLSVFSQKLSAYIALIPKLVNIQAPKTSFSYVPVVCLIVWIISFIWGQLGSQRYNSMFVNWAASKSYFLNF